MGDVTGGGGRGVQRGGRGERFALRTVEAKNGL